MPLKHCYLIKSCKENDFWQLIHCCFCRCGTESLSEYADICSLLLQVDMQFYIMSFLSPHDLCRLGSTCQYWHTVVRDPVLWRYFLLRDLPTWSFIDHNSMPDVEKISQPLAELDDDTMHDYMTEQVLKQHIWVCPATVDKGAFSTPCIKVFIKDHEQNGHIAADRLSLCGGCTALLWHAQNPFPHQT